MIFYGARKASAIHHRTDCSKSSVTEDDAYQRSGDDMPSMVMKAGEVTCADDGQERVGFKLNLTSVELLTASDAPLMVRASTVF